MEHDGCVGCKYEMCEPDSRGCRGCTQNSEDKYTKKTNREMMLELLSNDNYRLAKALIITTMVDDGDYSYDGEDEYWVYNYVEQYESPSGRTYADYDYDECLKETVEWLERKVD